MFTIFIEAAVDPVGREDRTKDFTSENNDENLLSENSAKTLSSKDRKKNDGCGHHAELILVTIIIICQEDLTWVIDVLFISKFCDASPPLRPPRDNWSEIERTSVGT